MAVGNGSPVSYDLSIGDRMAVGKGSRCSRLVALGMFPLAWVSRLASAELGRGFRYGWVEVIETLPILCVVSGWEEPAMVELRIVSYPLWGPDTLFSCWCCLMLLAVFSIQASRSQSSSRVGTVESAPIEMPTMLAMSS